ncbi:MAG: bifunctional 4-hydroxy-2-oxoglutarate aldolase/2-dehydro-3-deoxy-phosphogluconate aldolase [Cyclobacteriaceae bacterium]|nr:bifunctional 4-hydroxy-2-oxoglutarate aldolase/2-dehydro-3-deoxy-phosphogluconate aldolase [Cyclobacteriaceae bacterium]
MAQESFPDKAPLGGKDEQAYRIKTSGIIPVFFHPETELASDVLDACYAGGARAFEFTHRGKEAPEVFNHLLHHARKYPDLVLGIGTILSEKQALTYLKAGAHFIVSPVFNPALAEVCRHHQALWIPGCATPTEIFHAQAAGASIIKIFPASALGPSFIEAVLQVIPGLSLMPTGGISCGANELEAWFKAGAACIGLGSSLLARKADGQFNLTAIRENVTSAVKVARKYQQG